MIYKIVVDKQSRSNPSTEKKEYTIDIEELRAKGDVYDSLMFKVDGTYVMRRLHLSELQVLTILNEPIKESLENVNIELFEGDNYIYLSDMEGNRFYAEYLIRNEFNEVFATRKEMNSEINLTMQEIDLAVNQKLTNYSTTEETNALIQLLINQINLELEKKIDGETITGAYLLLKINDDTSEAKLKADKVNLSGYVTIDNLKTAGKTIIDGGNIITGTIDASKATITNINANNIKSGTITGRNISGGTITGAQISNGNNFNVDKNGNMKCKNGKFTGGKIELTSDKGNSNFIIKSSDGSQVNIFGNGFSIEEKYSAGIPAQIDIGRDENNNFQFSLVSRNLEKVTNITAEGIVTPTLEQTSLATKKKNFEKLQDALEILKQIDIYKYNLKGEKDSTKKHIGFVIGDKYNYSKEVTSNKNDGVDLYSFVSVCCKAIQEHQEQIEQQNNLIQSLVERIEKLEAK